MAALIQCVPRLPPVIDGVGDHAFNLATTLRNQRGMETTFVVCDPEWKGPGHIDRFSIVKLPAPSADALDTLLQSLQGPVLLHYSGYGYDRRGMPFWLCKGLADHSTRLLTFFHELWSSGFPWQTAFYWHFLQRRVVRRIHRISRVSVTTTVRMRNILGGSTSLLPVSSNIPPLPRISIPDRTRWRPLVFGQAGGRHTALRTHRRLLHELNDRGILDRVVIAGKDAGPADAAVLGPSFPIDLKSDLSVREIAQEFAKASCHLSGYPAYLACKSGTFMAALAAGCPVVLAEGHNADPLVAGTHFFVCDGSKKGVNELMRALNADAGSEGQRWYDNNADWNLVGSRMGDLIATIYG
ncbi:MAG: hypothetical protein H7039_20310 [Bryobacteraceae bacterium]|nr:hypothetical protein [Bryobacteraceae bacterium]